MILLLVSDLYIGKNPNLANSLKKHQREKWTLLKFYFFIPPLLHFILKYLEDPSFDEAELGNRNSDKMAGFLIKSPEDLGFLFSSLSFVVVPAILLEKKNSIQALERSIALCGSNMKVIFYCTGSLRVLLRFLDNEFGSSVLGSFVVACNTRILPSM